jgi:hypothetical protein
MRAHRLEALGVRTAGAHEAKPAIDLIGRRHPDQDSAPTAAVTCAFDGHGVMSPGSPRIMKPGIRPCGSMRRSSPLILLQTSRYRS